MLSINKRTVHDYMNGFRESDAEKVLSLLTEDVVWYMPGHFDLTGKEAFEKEMRNDLFVGSPTIRIIRVLEEDDVVIAEGEVRCEMKAGGILDALFCDVFQMKEGKIKQLTTYLMIK